MKQIVLKPVLTIGEKINSGGKIFTVAGGSYGTFMLKDSDGNYIKHEDGRELIFPSHNAEIIESPDGIHAQSSESASSIQPVNLGKLEVADAGKAIEECHHVYYPLCRIHKINNCMCSAIYFDPVCKKCGRVINCEKQEEKPALTLRWGGIYKDGRGAIEEIDYYYAPTDSFVSKLKNLFKKNGHRVINFDTQGDSIFNLIEEVKPEHKVSSVEEKPALTLKVGGVYKSLWRDGTISKIVKREGNFFVDHANSRYTADGKHLFGDHVCTSDDHHLIEEVQPDQEKNDAVVLRWHGYECKKHQTFGVGKNKNSCPMCEQEKDEIENLNKKPEGNPFKLGEIVDGYICAETIKRGEIEDINGLSVKLKGWDIWFHYKQCEKIE